MNSSLIELRGVTKFFGKVIALRDVSFAVTPGEVHCLLGDNGAGKSTLIKILSGVHPPSEGQILIGGEPIIFESPRDALDKGIATVYQDLSLVPLMSVARNFFLGREPEKGTIFPTLDLDRIHKTTMAALSGMGIKLRDAEQPVGTLSGGERQCVAIARAIFFGAKVLILDEATSALGVKQAGVVLKYVAQARDRGLGVVLITHNPHHAYPVGNRFLLLKRGRSLGCFAKADITLAERTTQMAGG